MDEQFQVTGEIGAGEVTAPWGTLTVRGHEIFGLQQLWLPNMSLSKSMAEDLASHLELAAGLTREHPA